MLRDITIGQYYNTNSLIHSLDPRVKLMGTFVFLIAVFIGSNILGYVVSGLFLLIIIKISKVPFSFLLRGLKSLMILLIISVIFNLFLTPGKTIFSFGFINITIEGILLTLKMAMRLVYLVIGSSILTLTTTPTQLTQGLEKSLSFLKKLNVPVTDIAMMMSIALRFIPILIDETDKIMKAQKARGADFDKGNLIQKAKSMVPLLIPLFVQSFRRASDLAEAMEVRCYNSSDKRTCYHPLIYKKIDYFSYFILFIFLIIMIVSNIIYNNFLKYLFLQLLF